MWCPAATPAPKADSRERPLTEIPRSSYDGLLTLTMNSVPADFYLMYGRVLGATIRDNVDGL